MLLPLGFLLLLATSIGTLSAADKISCETCYGLSCLIPQGITLRECPSEIDSCVSAFCNSIILARGCASEIALPKCEPTAKLITSVCTEKRCNLPKSDSVSTRDAASCVQCDQTGNRDCSVNPTILPSTPCTNGVTQCYTKLDDNGRISRGCLNDLSLGDQINCQSEFQENCVICNEIGCNRGILPANRLKCHQCALSVDPNCNIAKSPRTATYCEDYSPNNICLTVIKTPTDIRRLCSSNPSAQCTDALSCSTCGDDGCNHEGVRVTEINKTPCPTPPPPPPPPTTTPAPPPPTTTPAPPPSTQPPPSPPPPPPCPTCPTVAPPVPSPTPPRPNGVAKILPGSLLATFIFAILSSIL